MKRVNLFLNEGTMDELQKITDKVAKAGGRGVWYASFTRSDMIRFAIQRVFGIEQTISYPGYDGLAEDAAKAKVLFRKKKEK